MKSLLTYLLNTENHCHSQVFLISTVQRVVDIPDMNICFEIVFLNDDCLCVSLNLPAMYIIL